MVDARLAQRVTELEERLGRLERRLGLEEVPAFVQAWAPTPAAPRSVPPPLPSGARAVADAGGTGGASRSAPAGDTEARPGLEQALGLKWAGWIGAVVLVIGAIYGAAYAYEQGWLGHLPGVVRLGLMNLVGVAFLLAGEWVFRRINRLAATGFLGAGVAMLFVAAYAGHVYLGVYEPRTAFVFMVISALVGAAVAMRGRLVSIAVLALIGGILAPLLLPSYGIPFRTFQLYVTMLQVVALVLAWWGGSRKWWVLRGLALGINVWLMEPFTGYFHPAWRIPVLSFLVVQWALFQGELFLSAWRPPRADVRSMPKTGGMIFGIATTAAYIAMVLGVEHDAQTWIRGAWVLGTAVLCAGAGFLAATRGRATLRNLSLGWRIQGAGLVVLAVPVMLPWSWVPLGWGVLALAFAALGRARDLDLSRLAGLATWGLGALYLFNILIGGGGRDLHAVGLTIGHTPLPLYLLVGWVLALIGHLAATLSWPGDTADQAHQQARAVSIVQSIVTDGLWFSVSIIALPALGATGALVAYAWMLAGWDRVRKPMGYLWHAWALLALAAGKWVLADTLAARLLATGDETSRRWLMNGSTGTGVLVAGSVGLLYLLSRGRIARWVEQRGKARMGATPALAAVATVLALMGLALSVEVHDALARLDQSGIALRWTRWQALQMNWTMLWMAAIALMGWIAVRVEKVDPLRRSWVRGCTGGLALLAIKFLTVDTVLPRLLGGVAPAPVVWNFQVLEACVVLLLLWVGGIALRRSTNEPALLGTLRLLSALAVLWIVSLEIDRYYSDGSVAGWVIAWDGRGGFDPFFARQVALSVAWSMIALGSIGVGFVVREKTLRYFGLGLFALTLLKIVVVDLSGLTRGYRVLSFMGVGLLLLGTSVLYGKLSPRMTGKPPPARTTPGG